MTPRISAPQNERGVALPLALLALVMLSGLLLAFLAMSTHDPQIAQNHVSSSRAFYVADAGIEHTWALLPSTNLATMPLNLWGGVPQAFGSGTYSVTISQNPDLTYRLTSTGTYKDSTQTVVMDVKKTSPLPAVPGAVTFVSDGPAGSMQNDLYLEHGGIVSGAQQSGGNQGKDWSGTCDGVPGWVYNNGNLAHLGNGTAEGWEAGAPRAYRTVNAGDPSVWKEPTELLAKIAEWKALPGVVTIDGDAPPSANLGTSGAPQITVWKDTADNWIKNSWTGGVTGYGILILEADKVEFESNNKHLVFNGLVIFSKKTPNATTNFLLNTNSVINGGFVGVAAGATDWTQIHLDHAAASLASDPPGTVKYSCAGLNYAQQALTNLGAGGSGFTALSWKQQ